MRNTNSRFSTYKEQDISAKVARHTTSIFRQWHKEQWEDRSAYVPRGSCPVQPWEVILGNAEFRFHLNIAGTVCSGGQASQDGTIGMSAVRSNSRGMNQAILLHEAGRDGEDPFARYGPVEASIMSERFFGK
jgi:hypothetical protein